MLLAAMLLPWAVNGQVTTLPYSCDFEDSTEASAWTLVNGSQTNKWVLGTAQNNTPSGTKSIYISNNNGTAAAYTITSASVVYAYCEFTLQPGQYAISFDWKCYGESTYDYLLAALVDSTVTLTAGTALPTGVTNASMTAAGWTNLGPTGGSYIKMNLSSTWNTQTATFTITTAGTYRIVFVWRNDTTTGTAPGACVDNVQVVELSCPQPVATGVTGLTSTEATFTWQAGGSETGWFYSLNGSDWEYTTIASAYFDTLTPQTSYTLRVRAFCGADDTSLVTTMTTTTPCAPIEVDSLPWTYGFEDATGTTATATFNPCLGRHQLGTTTNYPAPNTNHRSGSKGLWLYRTSSIQSWLTLPLFEEDLDQLQLSFYAYRSTTTTYGYWVVGVMTDPNDISTLDTLATGHVSANSTWELVEVPLAGYTGNGQYIAIVAEQTGSSTGYTYIDDITVDLMPACFRPTDVTVDTTLLTSTSVTLNIDHPDATTFMVLWHRANTTGWDTLEVNGTSFTLDSLQTGLIYEGRVYTLCGSDTTQGFAPFSVTTACNPLTLDDLPYSEDFEDYGSGAAYPINACWNKGVVQIGTSTAALTQYPYPSATAINGTRSLYFYAYHYSTTNIYYNWMTLPELDENLDITNLMVEFVMKTHTTASTTTSKYSSYLVVGVTTDYHSTSGWVPVDTIDLSDEATGSVHNVEVNFANYTGTGRYIMFYAPAMDLGSYTYHYNTFYIDDIVLREVPSCYRPVEVALDSVSTDEATLSWTPDSRTPSPTGGWTVEYGPHGFTPGNGIVETATDTTITLSNLAANTEYDVYVSANCGGDMSDGRSMSFHTACLPVATADLPYIEDFESYESGSANPISPCWYKAAIDNATAYPYPTSAGAVSGSRCLFFYGYKSSSNARASYACLPMFESDLDNLMVEFCLRRYSTASATYLSMMNVGVMSDPSDPSTFELVEAIDISGAAASSVHRFRISLEGYNGTGRYITFFAPTPSANSTYNEIYLDSVVVSQLPTCRWPVNFAADSVGAHDVRLTWMGSAASFEVEYSTNANFTAATTSSVTTTDTVVTVGGLNDVTNYYFRVRGVCGNENSFWSNTVHVRTTLDCGPNSINIIDTIGDGTSAGATYAFYASTSYKHAFTEAIYSSDELNEMGLQVNNRINGIKLHVGSTGGTIRQAKIYMKEVSLNAFGSPLASDTVNRSTMTLVYSGNIVATASSWVEIMFDSAFTYSGNSNLMIMFAHDTTSTAGVTFYATNLASVYRNAYFYMTSTGTTFNAGTRTYYRPNVVFNICTEIPPCARPTDVTVVELSDTAMTLAWQGTAANYEVALSPTSVNPETATGLTTYTTANDTITITGLNPNATYYYYVRSVCSATENSEWSVGGSMTTNCSRQSLPYTENFDSYSAGTTAAAGQTMSPCWRKGTNNSTAYPYLYTTNKHSAPNGLYMYGTATYYCYAALPMMADSVKHLMMSFYAYKTSANYGKIWVGVMTDPNDFTTFTRYQRVNVSAVSTWESFEIDFSGYTGPEGCIAFTLHDSAANNAVLDDITVDVIPTCPRPTNVTVNNITQNTATVHWNHTATNFEIEYGPHGFVQGNGTTVTSVVDSVVLTGLALGTAYDVYVRAICSATDIGEWSFATSFYTECGIFPVPYFEDFENYVATSTSPIHPCWTKGTNNSTAYPYPSTTVVSSAKSLYFYSYHPSTSSSTAYYCYAALPEFSAPINTLELSFKMRRYSTATDYYTSLVVVGVMTNPANINTFTAVDTIDLKTAAASSIHEISVDFSGYTGTGGHIALYAPVPPLYGTATYSYNYFHVDDIYVGYIPACPRADNLTAEDATQNSVVLSWRDTIGSTQWVVSYAQDTSDNWTEVTANSNPFVLTGLTPNTIYKYKVAPICAGGQQSDWSRTTYRFSTAMVPATVPYTYNFEDAAEWQNWQTLSNNNAKWYRGTMAAGDTTNVMYLSADNGSTNSWLRAQVTNSAAYRDIDFGPVPHSYAVTFRYHGGGHNTGNYDGVTVLLEDPADIPVASSTYLESPWGHFGVVHARRDTTWGTHTVLFDNISGVHRVAFLHFNNAVSADTAYLNIAPAIDDITITMQTCERPDSVTVDAIYSTFATVHWLGDTAATYVVDYRPAGTTGTDLFDTVTGLSAVITGMTSNTTYNVWVRKICDDTTVSYWSSYATFTTALCPNAGVATIGDETSTTTTYASPVNNLWKNTLTETIIDSTELTGISDITTIGYYYNYATAMTKKTNVDIWIQPTTKSEFAGTTASDAEPLNTATALKVYHGPLNCSQGWNYFALDTAFHYSGSGNLMVIVDDNSGQYDGSSYTFKSTSTSQYKTFAFYSDSDNPDINNIPNSAGTKTRYQYRVVMKLIDCGVSTVCNAPEIVYDTTTETTATLTWTPTNAASYEVAMVQGTWVEPTAGTGVTGNTYTFSNLQPGTDYVLGVRAVCGENSYSDWTTVTVTTAEHPCYAPSGLTITNTTYDGGSIGWVVGEQGQNAFEVSVLNTTNSNLDTIAVNDATTLTLTGLYSDITYALMVRAVCGTDNYSDWSDTVHLTPLSCSMPTNVQAPNVTANSAFITWAGTASKYEVRYGVDISTSTSTGAVIVVENTTTATLTNLDEETQYDVYVRAMCADGVTSDWTEKFQFTTAASSGEGINDVFGSNVVLYPNPASTQVTIAGLETGATVTLVDLNGRKSGEWRVESTEMTIDLTGYAQGAYFVRIVGEQGAAVRKLIVK